MFLTWPLLDPQFLSIYVTSRWGYVDKDYFVLKHENVTDDEDLFSDEDLKWINESPLTWWLLANSTKS